MNNELPGNLGEVGTGPEAYFARRKGAVGGTFVLHLREKPSATVVLPLYSTPRDGREYVDSKFGNADQYEFVSSHEVGGILPLLRDASSTCTRVTVDPPTGDGQIRIWPINEFIRICELGQMLELGRSGGQRPCWEILYKRNRRVVYAIEGEPGVAIICLFKTEMDAEEYMNSRGLGSEWEANGPVDADNAIAFLRELSSRGQSDVVINPPPGSNKAHTTTKIKYVLDHLEERGHIRDL